VTERLKPGVARHWLFTIAGLVWFGVAVMLVRLAYGWLVELDLALGAVLAGFGIVVGVLAGLTLFSRIARKNIERIAEAPDIACVFSFQAWEGYLIMTFMIALGVLLRHSPVPTTVLAPTYAAVGTALAVSSVRYFRAGLARDRDALGSGGTP
jgi:hypothetical protein